LFFCALTKGQTATDLLANAEKLADQGERYRAAPLYASAEDEFRAAGDARNELFAKFGRLRTESDHGDYKSIKAQVEHDLTSATVGRDPTQDQGA
jgi:hypothetical protein